MFDLSHFRWGATMKVVIAVDSFKGSVSAPDACRALAEGIAAVRPDAHLVECPMADGGEGTADVLLSVMNGEWVACEVTGPVPLQRVKAGYAWFPASRLAVVEMASASGLVLVDAGDRDPMKTTTYGTGELLAAAIRHGAERILLAVGGSATVDGGMGAASALGWKFLDESGRELPGGGGELRRLREICSADGPRLPPIEVLCDVTNPLLGVNGAARVYGPQKGATAETVPLLEAGLAQLARCIAAATGREVGEIPGGGAAGGLAAGAYGLLGARLTPGAETVLDTVGLPEKLKGADWLLTGEGQFDGQSAQGKVVSAVAAAGRLAGARTAVVAGRVTVEPAAARGLGIDVVLQSSPPGMPVAEAMAAGASLLRTAGEQFARLHLGA